MTHRLVTSTIDDGVGELRLTHARKRNAVGPEMVAQAFEAMDGFARAGVQVAVLSADAPVFCAGNDLDELGTLTSIADFSVTRLVQALLERPIFWVAAVDGPALGGGMALVAACPMVVVSDRASFALPELNVGLFPAGVRQYLEVVMGARAALDAGVTGRRIEAPEAVQ
ncbi:MAG: enoyl-CoA hydratase/isomerase family protein, partial [Umezawaea sp.]